MNGDLRTSIPSTTLDAPNIEGVLLVNDWNAVEPTEGTFQWSLLDGMIAQAAAAGKKISLSLKAGYATPSWVYADGAKSVPFVWDQAGWGPPLCSVQLVPLPWDAVYLAKWSKLVAAFGVHYNSNPTVTSIKLTGINSKTGEISIHATNNEKISGGKISCTGYNDQVDWQKAGYTRVLVENAWSQIIPMFQRSFPNKLLVPMMEPWGFPALDDNGNTIPNEPNDPYLSPILVSTVVSTLGAQLALQNDGLSGTWIWPVEESYASQVITGYQMVGVMGKNLTAAVNLAVTGDAGFAEIREQDLNNSSLQSEITHANNTLQ